MHLAFRSKVNKISNKRIYNERNNIKKAEYGKFETCFEKAIEFFKHKSFSNLKLDSYDPETLSLIFINNSKDF